MSSLSTDKSTLLSMSRGVILMGCSFRGSEILEMLVRKYPNSFYLAGFYDPIPAALEVMRTKFAEITDTYQARQPVFTTELSELLVPIGGLVFVASINSLHTEHAVWAMERGLDVFCEKPLATTIDDCIKMQNVVRRTGRRFLTGFVLRHAPPYMKVAELISTGEIGEITNIDANDMLHYGHGALIMGGWRNSTKLSGGHVTEKLCHVVDLCNWWTCTKRPWTEYAEVKNAFDPNRPKVVTGLGSKMTWTAENGRIRVPEKWSETHDDPDLLTKYKTTKAADLFADGDDRVNDTMSCIIKYESGAIASITTSTACPDTRRQALITGTLGQITLDFSEGTTQVSLTQRGAGRSGFAQQPARKTVWDYQATNCHGGGDSHIVESIKQSLIDGMTVRPGLEEAQMATLTSIALENSIASEQSVAMRPIFQEMGLPIMYHDYGVDLRAEYKSVDTIDECLGKLGDLEDLDLSAVTAAFTICIDSKRGILLTQHSSRGTDIVGGHVENGELPMEAAIRETWEESYDSKTGKSVSLRPEQLRLVGMKTMKLLKTPAPDGYKYTDPSYNLYYAAKTDSENEADGRPHSDARGRVYVPIANALDNKALRLHWPMVEKALQVVLGVTPPTVAFLSK